MYSMFKPLLEMPLKEAAWIAIIAALINFVLFYIVGFNEVMEYCDGRPILGYSVIIILSISILITLLTIIVAGYKLAYLMLFS